MTRALLSAAMYAALLALFAFLAGCGGGGDDCAREVKLWPNPVPGQPAIVMVECKWKA